MTARREFVWRADEAKVVVAVVKMHDDEVDIDESLVRRLLAAQFPQWAGLSIKRVASAGTDNAIFRLGDDKAVRLPRIPRATGQVEYDQRWLPRFAARLPLAVPEPLGHGSPAEGYAWTWGIYRWLDGQEATLDRLANPCAAAINLAEFVRALQRVDAADGPLATNRGVPLADRDDCTRESIGQLHGEVDVDGVTAAWDEALAAPVWTGQPVWVHGDLAPGNLLVNHGRLTAVIDFACMAVGDPACDLQPAWNLLAGASRKTFRAALGVDQATWARGRGWALSVALLQLPYYLHTNPGLVANSRRVISEVLADRLAASHANP